MLRIHHARRRLGELKPPERRLGDGGHDLVEVLSVEPAVLKHAVLKEADTQDPHGTTILQVHDHLRVADKAFRVGREPTRIGEELVERALCNGHSSPGRGRRKDQTLAPMDAKIAHFGELGYHPDCAVLGASTLPMFCPSGPHR